ncbi:unnamed protein product [Closterium sp. NIES-65]|nr:unnamed protein product [Closterium sp. NIES-65]
MFHWCSPSSSPAATCPSVPSATCGAGCPSSSTFLSALLSPPSPASPDRSSPPSLLSAMYALLGPRNTSVSPGCFIPFRVASRPPLHRIPNGDESREKGDESREKGDESREKGDESREKSDEIRKKGDESREKGDASREKGDESREKNDKSREKGDESREKGDESREKGDEKEPHRRLHLHPSFRSQILFPPLHPPIPPSGPTRPHNPAPFLEAASRRNLLRGVGEAEAVVQGGGEKKGEVEEGEEEEGEGEEGEGEEETVRL